MCTFLIKCFLPSLAEFIFCYNLRPIRYILGQEQEAYTEYIGKTEIEDIISSHRPIVEGVVL